MGVLSDLSIWDIVLFVVILIVVNIILLILFRCEK